MEEDAASYRNCYVHYVIDIFLLFIDVLYRDENISNENDDDNNGDFA